MKTMTVKEVSEVLGVSRQFVSEKVKELFPNIVENGKTTILSESHVTAIKLSMQDNTYLPHLAKVKTSLEKALLIRQAMELQNEIIEEQQVEIDRMKPKEIAYDKFLSAENSQPVGDVAKMYKIGRNKLFKMLREAAILMSDNTPYQEYMKYFDVIDKPVTIGSRVENKPVTMVKASGIDYIGKRLHLIH